jgi:hypothetical protein
MAGGLETALLIGAATGAGTSALTGGDPLKGALFGALGGAVMPGIGQALGGAQAGTAAALGNVADDVAFGAGSRMIPNVEAALARTSAGTAYDFGLGAGKIPFGSTTATAPANFVTGLTEDAVGAALNNNLNFGLLSNQQALQLAKSGIDITKTGLTPGSAGAASFGTNVGASTSPYSLVGGAVPPNTVGGSLLREATGKVVPETGFTDIFKSTPGGPEFKQRLGNYIVQNPGQAAMSGAGLANTLFNQPKFSGPDDEYDGPLKRFRFNPENYRPAFAEGGITDIDLGSTATLSATPVTMMARGGGIADLGGYSDGGRLLKGPGDGMSDSIPARIGRRQPARLADGEFVVPADVVSHLGNGSTDAGAKQLYDMMDKVRRARTGNKKQGREINPRRFVPA